MISTSISYTILIYILLQGVLNIGWDSDIKCAGGDWLRSGDYLTTSSNPLHLEANQTIYRVDIDLQLYSRSSSLSSFASLSCWGFLAKMAMGVLVVIMLASN